MPPLLQAQQSQIPLIAIYVLFFALIYLLMTLPLSQLVVAAERKLKRA